MKKSLGKEEIVRRSIKSILNEGATFESCAETYGYSEGTIRKWIREHYKNPELSAWYKKLLKKQRENVEALKKEKELVPDIKEPETVFLVETGYLMDYPTLIDKMKKDIYIPYFCVRELQNLCSRCQSATIALEKYRNSKITSINIGGWDNLLVEPESFVKPRTMGVVAVAIELCSRGFKVKLFTTSYEISKLARKQECGIEVNI